MYHITAGLLQSRDKKMGVEKPVCATPPPKKNTKKVFYSFYVYFYTGKTGAAVKTELEFPVCGHHPGPEMGLPSAHAS